jgi:phytoene synthase
MQNLLSPWTLSSSYSFCERLTRKNAGNFYPAFRLLPADQRKAICALYAFLRVADDLGDGAGSTSQRRLGLTRWRDDLNAALASDYRHPALPALHHAITRFQISPRHLEDVIDGIEMDLGVVRFSTFVDLYPYCYRVASAVGLACIQIWGNGSAEARRPAEAAGVALQLTNILRDVREDASRGRVYLPLEDLDRFGYTPEQVQEGLVSHREERFRALMRFEADRAYTYYEKAKPLIPLLPAAGRAVFSVMLKTYRSLLDAIVRRDFDVFTERVRLSRVRKFWLALSAVPLRVGLPAYLLK